MNNTPQTNLSDEEIKAAIKLLREDDRAETVLQFIKENFVHKSLLLQQKQEIKEKAEKLKGKYIDLADLRGIAQAEGYDEAVNDMINLLSNPEEK